MVDKIFKVFKRNNSVDWGIIFEGWKGVPGYKLGKEEIEDFAIKNIESLEGDILIIVADLASTIYLENSEITILLQEICEIENIDLEFSRRKWRLVLLNNLIKSFNNDCLYDLLELTDFWINWKNPSDKPHIIQGLDSNMNPTEYYSDKNHIKIVETHRAWMVQEQKELNLYI